MPEFWFYHLEQTPIAQALPELLERVVARGWRAYVHFGTGGLEDDKIQALDQQLWTYDPASFLAHGREGGEDDARQPVLLGTSGSLANRPDVYLSAAPAGLPDVDGLQRCLIVFEGADEAHLAWARAQWKDLKGRGASLAYWKQNERGRWEKVQ